MIHEYFGVDLSIICETIQHDLAGLENVIEDLLKNEQTWSDPVCSNQWAAGVLEGASHAH